jgi:hypothetical protein
MRRPSTFRPVFRLLTLAAVVVAGALGAVACFGPDVTEIWICLNPVTGKEDSSIYDSNHYVNGVFDPCHCYDPCGPEKSCPDVVDAGPRPPGCDGGGGGDGGP